MTERLTAANLNIPPSSPETGEPSDNHIFFLLDWLSRLARQRFFPATTTPVHNPANPEKEIRKEEGNSIAHICGHTVKDFAEAGAPIPLSAAEIDYFRRNHRGTENHVCRDFLTAQTDLPSPLAELYGLYRHRARVDAEAALWVTQATMSTRVASSMADLLAIGAFENGAEFVSYMGTSYSVPCAFDTSHEIDHANQEALRRLTLPVDHPSHLLRLTPGEIGVLATSIAKKNALSPEAFLEKAQLLSIARQDVARMPKKLHFATSMIDQDLPAHMAWTQRIVNAYTRIFPAWIADIPPVLG